ncbi:MAG: hypothetical protein MUE94_02690 [Verrucomicrobia bacterium]|nr:hypothetical protein [Verrucomicrobiota bacterium]
MDRLLGNLARTVILYEEYPFALPSVSMPAGSACVVQWNSAPFLNYNLLAGSSPDDVASPLATNCRPTAGAHRGQIPWRATAGSFACNSPPPAAAQLRPRLRHLPT